MEIHSTRAPFWKKSESQGAKILEPGKFFFDRLKFVGVVTAVVMLPLVLGF